MRASLCDKPSGPGSGPVAGVGLPGQQSGKSGHSSSSGWGSREGQGCPGKGRLCRGLGGRRAVPMAGQVFRICPGEGRESIQKPRLSPQQGSCSDTTLKPRRGGWGGGGGVPRSRLNSLSSLPALPPSLQAQPGPRIGPAWGPSAHRSFPQVPRATGASDRSHAGRTALPTGPGSGSRRQKPRAQEAPGATGVSAQTWLPVPPPLQAHVLSINRV